MKLQGLSIVFGLIVVPMILVLSYYIQLQVDTIALQTSYDSKLLGATHDAMLAFELNTANEDLSSVADSLRSIIDASNNIFINTLATSLELSNASKSFIEPYIPATLYTLYDGYYINSPTKEPVIGVDSTGVVLEIAEGKDRYNNNVLTIPGLQYKSTVDNFGIYEYNPADTTQYTTASIPSGDFGQLLYKMKDGKYTTNINSKGSDGKTNLEYENEYILKTYMPYSARYVKYSATYGDIDVTINYTLDNYLTVIGNIGNIYYTKSGYLINPNTVQDVKIEGNSILSYNENDAETQIQQALNEGREVSVKLLVKNKSVNPATNVNVEIKANNLNADKDKADAIIYYAKAKIFSDWIYKNLSDLEEQDIIESMSNTLTTTTEKSSEEIIHDFEGKTNKIFNIYEDPEEDSSIFVDHKFNVIKNSIQYNLNLAMSVYNTKTQKGYNFNMPVISNDEWLKIIDNVSMVSFMQGLNCGLKTYNNYAIVSSTNNELEVIPEEIYFVNADKFNTESGVYHRIDCPRLKEEITKAGGSMKLTSFVSKEVKYDKLYDKTSKSYNYDHKNLACYTCIVDGNYTSEQLNDTTRPAYYIALGKERYNVYKMNAVKYSEGYEILYGHTTRALKEIKKIEITFGHIRSDNFNENIVSIKFNHPDFPNEAFPLNTNQSKEQTITLNINSNSGSTITLNDIMNMVNENESTSDIDISVVQSAIKKDYIKIVYK